MRKWKIARVRYYPYRYNHVLGKLLQTKGGNIVLSYSLTKAPLAKGALSSAKAFEDTVFDATLRRISSNYLQAEKWYKTPTKIAAKAEVERNGYLIITTSEIISGSSKLQDFINHKRSLFNIWVATEAVWQGGQTADTKANNIRKYLQDNYIAKGIKYVLLIGNPHPIENTVDSVPMKLAYPLRGNLQVPNVATDYYYADLTGNWDRDGDNYYAEVPDDFDPEEYRLDSATGGVDLYPEVFVGRIPFYGNFQDLDSILQKIIDYEQKRYTGDWLSKVLISIKPLDNWGIYEELGEIVREEIVKPLGLQGIRIYDGPYGSSIPDYTPVNYENVLSAWQEGVGFHLLLTHGSIANAAGIVTSTNTQFLDNSHPAFTFHATCLNGYPEEERNLAYQLLKQGAIATDSASRIMFGTSWFGNDVRYSHTAGGLAYQYAKNLITNNLPCGEAHAAMIISVPVYLNNQLALNLYGDPSVSYGYLADTTPPVGEILINNGAAYTNSTSVVLNLKATDSGLPLKSGKMRFSNDNTHWSDIENFKPFKEWVLSTGEGKKSVYVQFMDAGRNWSGVYTDDILLDSKAKVPVTVDSGIPEGWSNKAVTITLTASSPNGKITKTYYSLDGSLPNLEYRGPFNVSGGSVYTLRYYSQDESGIKEAIKVASRQIKIDEIPPSGSISLKDGAKATNSQAVTLNLQATDAGSGMGSGSQMQFSNDNLTWSTPESYASTKAWTLSRGDGTKTVYVKFKDLMGNWSTVYSDNIILDTTPPAATVLYRYSGKSGWLDHGETFYLMNPEADAVRIYYTLDGSEPTPTAANLWSDPYIAVGHQGITTVKYYAVDSLGNREATKTEEIKIDTTPPTTPVFKNCRAVYNPATKKTILHAEWSSSDSGSGIKSYAYYIIAGQGGILRLITDGFQVRDGIIYNHNRENASLDYEILDMGVGKILEIGVVAENGLGLSSQLASPGEMAVRFLNEGTLSGTVSEIRRSCGWQGRGWRRSWKCSDSTLPLSGAMVIVRGADALTRGITKTTTTATNGSYSIADLPQGNYTVMASTVGPNCIGCPKSSVSISPGTTSRRHFSLRR